MKTTASLILATVIFAASCVPSINPIFTEQDLIYNESLVGTWLAKETGETWTLSGAGKLEYLLVHTDSTGRKGEFSVRLVKLEDKTLLDMTPVKPGFSQNDFYQGHYFATHTFVRIELKGSNVEISYLEPTWLKDHLGQNPNAIRHETVGGQIVLTSSPKETQKFLLTHLNTRGAFAPPEALVRKRGGQ